MIQIAIETTIETTIENTTNKKVKNQNRGANGTKGSGWIKPYKRLAIYQRDNFCCVYCLADLTNVPNHLRALDHITPMSHEAEGADNEQNLVLACSSCNSSKQDQSFDQFIAISPRVVAGVEGRVAERIVKKLNIVAAKQTIKDRKNSK